MLLCCRDRWQVTCSWHRQPWPRCVSRLPPCNSVWMSTPSRRCPLYSRYPVSSLYTVCHKRSPFLRP